MNQYYGYQDEQWFTNQFVNNELQPQQYPQQNGIDNNQTNAPQAQQNYNYTSVPKNFNNLQIKDECLNDNFMNQPQQFNDFVSNNSNNQNNQNNQNNNVNNQGSISNYNSSDKSSPSSILNNNNVLTNQDINSITQEINSDPKLSIDESNLSEKEIADRRKAQNRAAQRAFRERKELKLKELENKLSKSESNNEHLLKQLQDLQKQNVVISTENKLLLQNGNTLVPLNPGSTTNPTQSNNSDVSFSFPSPDYHTKQSKQQSKGFDMNSFQVSPGRLDYSGINLTITQVWEYLVEINDKYDKDYDLNFVMEQIKGLEVCHERGAAYPKKIIDAFLEQYDKQA